MRIVVHREIPDDPNLEARWNALAQKMEPPEVFYTYQWARAMQAAYGSTLIPLLILLYNEEMIVGIAALATDPEGWVASFLSGTTADYCDFLSEAAHRSELVEASFGELAKFGTRKIEFANLPADSLSVAALRATARRRKHHILLRPAYLCAQVNLGTGEARRSLRSSVLRKSTFRRVVAKLSKEGALELRNARSWAEIEPILPTFFAAHVSRFLATGRISNIASSERRTFLTELARSLARSGWMNITQLCVGPRVIASNFGFQFGGSWFWYQPTFDTSYEPLSPGYCLLAKIVDEACENPELQRVDLGLGAEGYKERFANQTRATLHGTITTSNLEHAKVVTRYGLVRAIAHAPKVESFVRTARARIEAAAAVDSGLGLLARALTRLRERISGREEVLFYEWPKDGPEQSGNLSNDFRLVPLDLAVLATAAMHFAGDRQTCAYLLRCAQRLRGNQARGFALLDSTGVPVHFSWVQPFEGFAMAELKVRLESESSNADLIFDCWTPMTFRGRGYYAQTISSIARTLTHEGRAPWIFSAATNFASLRGIEQAGFQPRHSLVRRRAIGIQRIHKIRHQAQQVAELPVAS